MRSSTLKFTRLTALFSFLASAAVGCVISVGDGGKSFDGEECPDPNSDYDDGKCFCDFGYDWCDENDNSNLDCCVSQTTNGNDDTSNNTNNQTDDGTTTDDPTSGTTEDVPTTSNSGTTGDPLECTVDASPPASCDANTENFLCLQASNPECSSVGSKFYICENGTWVEDPSGPDENCKADGFDFGYGCLDIDMMVQFECGIGPGTDCSEGPTTCDGETKLEECYLGKLNVTDCEAYCMEVGDGMMTFDYGFCGEQDGANACLCCDEGDEGCPINEGTTDGGETTSGDTGTTGG